jgi:hypothetical protein
MTLPRGRVIFCIKNVLRDKIAPNGGDFVKKDEKKPIPWEAVDPKPPVVQSGHMEDRRQYRV